MCNNYILHSVNQMTYLSLIGVDPYTSGVHESKTLQETVE